MNCIIRFFALLFIFFIPNTMSAQEAFLGNWHGSISVQGASLRLVLHVTEVDGKYQSTFDSPSQGAYGIPFRETVISGETITCKEPSMGIVYQAKLVDGMLQGEWMQGGAKMNLDMKKLSNAVAGPKRPQNPKGKIPYEVREVSIEGPDGVTLAGTLTMPKGKGPFPAVVLVSGSGPQNRDCELMDHKPFWVLADHLTRKGIAVLRYDDRGVAASTGDFATATSADFADDTEAVFNFLRKQAGIDPSKTGIAGLSEGGMVGPMVAARNPDVAFVVMLAGPAVPGKELLLAQTEAVLTSAGAPKEQMQPVLALNEQLYDYVLAQPDAEAVANGLDTFVVQLIEESGGQVAGLGKAELKQAAEGLQSPWMYYFIHHDPKANLAALRSPVLALYGGKDVQVPAGLNSVALEAIFAESGVKHKVVTFEHCNHLFQTAKTGAVSEYGQIEQTMEPKVMAEIASWINALGQ